MSAIAAKAEEREREREREREERRPAGEREREKEEKKKKTRDKNKMMYRHAVSMRTSSSLRPQQSHKSTTRTAFPPSRRGQRAAGYDQRRSKVVVNVASSVGSSKGKGKDFDQQVVYAPQATTQMPKATTAPSSRVGARSSESDFLSIIVLGASGDLAKRKVIPALFAVSTPHAQKTSSSSCASSFFPL